MVDYAADRSYGIVKSSALPNIFQHLDNSANSMTVTCCANTAVNYTGSCGPGTGVSCSQFCSKGDNSSIGGTTVFKTSEAEGQNANWCGLLPWFSGRYGLYDINYCTSIINKPVEIQRKRQTCGDLGVGWYKHPSRKACYKSGQIE